MARKSQEALKHVSKWYVYEKQKLAAKKCKTLVVKEVLRGAPIPSLKIGNEKIQIVRELKYLSVTFLNSCYMAEYNKTLY